MLFKIYVISFLHFATSLKPENDGIIPGRRSLEQCQKWGEKWGKCFIQPVQYILGGTDAEIGEFPHVAALGYEIDNNIAFICAGSLISDQHIITAAHCCNSKSGGPVKYVRLGEITNGNTKITPQLYYTPSNIIMHPNFHEPAKYNDICIIKLSQKVIFTNVVKPICLNTRNMLGNNTVIATGWGSTVPAKFGYRDSKILQKVDLTIFEHKNCSKIYGNVRKRLSKGIDAATQICAGSGDLGRDTCLGDSGGALQIFNKNSCMYDLIGVTSFGMPCGTTHFPGVYSRISGYLAWIESIIWD